MKASNELTTVGHIYPDKIKEEKRKLIEQEWEIVHNNPRCIYQTDKESKADETGEK